MNPTSTLTNAITSTVPSGATHAAASLSPVVGDLLAALLYPGLVFSFIAGLLLVWWWDMWASRRTGRPVPGLGRPIWDLLKLFGKNSVGAGPHGLQVMLPLVALATTVAALALLPLPGTTWQGASPVDLVVLVGLIQVAPILSIVAGAASGSPYGQMGAARQATAVVAYGLPLIFAMVAMGMIGHSFDLPTIALAAPTVGALLSRVLAGVALLSCLSLQMSLLPRDLSDTPGELAGGIQVEMSGVVLGLWRLVHLFSLAATSCLFALVIVPVGSWGAAAHGAFVAVAVLLGILAVAMIGSGRPRARSMQVFEFYWWSLPLLLALVAFVVAYGPLAFLQNPIGG